MDIVLRIKEEYRKLTKSEKKVADYFIENYKDAINESTQSIAVATDTSPATVIRFVKTLTDFNSLSLRLRPIWTHKSLILRMR